MPDEMHDPLADYQAAVAAEFAGVEAKIKANNNVYDVARRLERWICLSHTREQVRSHAEAIMEICEQAEAFPEISSLVTVVRDRLLPVIRIPVPPRPETPTDTVEDLHRQFLEQLELWPQTLRRREFGSVTSFAPALFDKNLFEKHYVRWAQVYKGIDDLLMAFRHKAQPDAKNLGWFYPFRDIFFRLNALLHNQAGAK